MNTYRFSELDDEFLAVATQVPTDYTMNDEMMNEEINLGGLNNLTDMLVALNACIRWVAWIIGTTRMRFANRFTMQLKKWEGGRKLANLFPVCSSNNGGWKCKAGR